MAKKETLAFLEDFKVEKEVTRDLLVAVARTSLHTKIHPDLGNPLCEILVDSVECISKPRVKAVEGEPAPPRMPIDLHMVEVMHMQHKMSTESKLVRGLVLDHGGR